MTKSLMLFTNDLRVDSNRALAEASKNPFVMLKVVDWTTGRLPGRKAAANELRCVEDLRRSVMALGGHLVVRFGSAHRVAREVFNATGCTEVHATRTNTVVDSNLTKTFTSRLVSHGMIPGGEVSDLSGSDTISSVPIHEIARQTEVGVARRQHPDSPVVLGTAPMTSEVFRKFTPADHIVSRPAHQKNVLDKTPAEFMDFIDSPSCDEWRDALVNLAETADCDEADLVRFSDIQHQAGIPWNHVDAYVWEHHGCPHPNLFTSTIVGEVAR